MSTKQLPVSDFCEHAADEMAAVEGSNTIVELTRNGQIIAYLTPAPRPKSSTGTLADWIGTGLGMVSYAPGVDPDEPAFSPEEWEDFPHGSKE